MPLLILKTRILKRLAGFIFLSGLLFNAANSFAQSIVAEDFERANVFSGSSPTTWGTTQSAAGFTTTSTSPIDGSQSLTFNVPSSGSTTPTMSSVLGGSTISYSSSQPPYEWTLLYQAPASVTPSDPNTTTVTGNDWRFFFSATGNNPAASGFNGYFVTQDGNAIKFFYLCTNCGSKTQIGTSFTVTAGSKYIIRAVRQTNNGGSYLFYVTQYTSSTSFPTTDVNSGTATFDQVGSYITSFFQSSLSSSANNGIFKWDDLNFYHTSLTLSGLNVVGTGTGGNGIAAFLTQNDAAKAVFGFKATSLGTVTMTDADFSWTTTGSGNSTYFQNAKLYYSSADDVYTPAADDNSIGSVTLNFGSATISGLSETITNASRSYFLVVDVKNYAAASTATASIGLTDAKITGNSPITISSSIAGTSFTLPSTPDTWTGGTTAWSLGTNWSGGLPTSTTSVVIPTGMTNYPILSADVTVSTLSMTNASVNLNGHILNVNNSILANNSTITGTGASYLDATGGSGDRSISGSGLTVTNCKVDLPLSTNTFYVYAPVSVSAILTPTKGIINAGGNLTLTSSLTQTASVDAITTANASITGNVAVQRYFTGGTTTTRGYRLLSAPVNSNSISTGGSTGYFTISNLTNLYTGGPAGTGGGFTVTNSGTPTVFLYREDTAPNTGSFNGGNYKGFAALNVTPFSIWLTSGTYTMYTGNGFMLYYVGSTAGTNFGTTKTPDNAVAVYTGTLNQGAIPVKLWYNASTNFTYTGSTTATGFALVGNPYASTIDLNSFSNATSTAGIYAPGNGTSTGITGAFYEYNYTNKTFETYQSGVGTGSATRYIASGQGFFVKAVAANATVTFNETAKASGGQQPTTLLMGLPATVNKQQLVHIKFAQDLTNSLDIALLFEAGASNGYELDLDAEQPDGIGNLVSLSSRAQNSGVPLSINHMHTIDSLTRVKLTFSGTTGGIDTLSGWGFDSLDPRYDVYLLDHYKKDSTLFSQTKQYLFSINPSDTTSFGSTRFELVFHKKAALANYKLLSFTAAKVSGGIQLANSGIQLTWKVQNEDKFTGFTIQRADGSLQFLSLYSLQSDGSGTYTYTDLAPLTGLNKYRLMQNGAFDNISYSEILTIDATATSTDANPISLYPNPVVNQLQISIGNNPPSQVHLTIMNASSGTVMTSLDMSSSNIQQNVSSLSTGSYIVEVSDVNTKKVIGRKKFIKL